VQSFQALLLGIVQALSEFLPISSSAHLTLIPWFFGWKDPFIDGLTFDVALHWGTLLAVMAFFWRDWVNMISAAIGWLLRRRHDTEAAQMFGMVLLATIPGGVAGLMFDEQAAATFRSPWLIALLMGLFALLLLGAELLGKHTRELKRLGPWEALGIGLLQALAILPGVSRSGVTITGGLFLNLRREAAARFSFLLLTPIVAGTAVLKGGELVRSGVPAGDGLPLIIGITAAAIVGFACIGFLMRFIQNRSFFVFVTYRIALSLVVFALVISGFNG
jgi:undecaprenyl-diphosphatase